MRNETIARILATHVVRGWEDRWPVVTSICMCGDEVTADDHHGINRQLAVEELHARHQAEAVMRVADTDAAWGRGFIDGLLHGRKQRD